MFVLNNPFAREILKLRDVESSLGSKVAFELPYDPFLYLKAVNEGIPIVIGAARSAPAERLVRLTGSAFGDDGRAPVPAAAQEKKSGDCSGDAGSASRRDGAGAGTRTLTPLRAADFKSAASAIPPLRPGRSLARHHDGRWRCHARRLRR